MNPFAPSDETLQIVSRDPKTGQVGTKTRIISYGPVWSDGCTYGFWAGIILSAVVVILCRLYDYYS